MSTGASSVRLSTSRTSEICSGVDDAADVLENNGSCFVAETQRSLVERENSVATFVSGRSVATSQSRGYPCVDTFVIFQTESIENAPPPEEEEADDELHWLRCENANLLKRVQQLESQIEETRVGLIEIFNQKAQRVETAGFMRQASAASETSSQQRELVTENSVMKELLMYLMPGPEQDVSLDKLKQSFAYWNQQKDVLRDENEELDVVLDRMETGISSEEEGLPKALEFERNIDLIEQELEAKANVISSLESRLHNSEVAGSNLSSQLKQHEDLKSNLKAELETERRTSKEIRQALWEARTKIRVLSEQNQERQRLLDSLTAKLSATESLLSKEASKRGLIKAIRRALSSRRSRNKSSPKQPFTPVKAKMAPEVCNQIIDMNSEMSIGSSSAIESTLQADDNMANRVSVESSGRELLPRNDTLNTAVALLQDQLKKQESQMLDLRRQLQDEERVRVNLERLLADGNHLMQSLTGSCKNHLRDLKHKLHSAGNLGSGPSDTATLEQDIEQFIICLDRLKPTESSAQDHLVEEFVINPPLDPRESRSDPIEIQ